MLQQTQVATVIPYYERFLTRFPTPATLATAPEQTVLKLWEGLGYYRRAKNLQAAARVVVREHGSRVPDVPAAFAALPGIGRYTCGAVQSIAFGHALPAVDGNALRVIARWLGVTACIDLPGTRRRIERTAEALVPKTNPGDWNQAVMELGATICLPRNPRCDECPVAKQCHARVKGLQDRIPKRKIRKTVPHIEVGVGIVWRRGRILLCKRPADVMLGGLWEFPGGKRERGETVTACIRRELREECDLSVTVCRHLMDVTHAYTHLQVTLRCHYCRAGTGRVKPLGCDDARWVRPQDLRRYPLPAANVRIVSEILKHGPLAFQENAALP
jgi:A/G-specific adenine glycosylase